MDIDEPERWTQKRAMQEEDRERGRIKSQREAHTTMDTEDLRAKIKALEDDAHDARESLEELEEKYDDLQEDFDNMKEEHDEHEEIIEDLRDRLDEEQEDEY